VLRRAWNDSVWSKVIAAGITAGVAAVGSLAFAHWDTVATSITQSVSVPLWALVLLPFGVAVLMAALLGTRYRKRMPVDGDLQPNAVPITRMDVRLLGQRFEDLSPQQQRFLAQQFRRGTGTARLEGWDRGLPRRNP
jgi:hypothetical protein